MIKDLYIKEIIPKLKEKLVQKNTLALPRIKKIVVHVGFGKHIKETTLINHIRESLIRITGQKPVDTVAKKSISNFKLRKGTVIGMKVTLRGTRMYDFLEKLICVTLPRIPDFRGISRTSIDGTGNIHIGFKDQIPFPETRSEDISNPHGVEVSIITTAGTKERGVALFECLGFPFNNETVKKKKIKNKKFSK